MSKSKWEARPPHYRGCRFCGNRMRTLHNQEYLRTYWKCRTIPEMRKYLELDNYEVRDRLCNNCVRIKGIGASQ
jgi:hypothetical protein